MGVNSGLIFVLLALAATACHATHITIGATVSSASSDEYKGYILAEEYINKLCFNVSGTCAQVNLTTLYDGNDATVATSNIAQLIDTHGSTFILGPSVEIVSSVASVCESKSTLMVSGTAQMGQHASAVFLNPPATTYSQKALQTLADKGATTMAIIGHNDTALAHQLISGAQGVANQTGITITSTNILTSSVLLSNVIKDLITQFPCIVFVADKEDNAVAIGIAAELNLFAPDAFLFYAGPSSSSYRSAVGERGSQYNLQLLEWDAAMNATGKVFGSASDYQAAFKAKYGENPTQQAAAASASLVALMHAIEQAQSVSQVAVKNAFQNLTADTFYGPLCFDSGHACRSLSLGQVTAGNTFSLLPDDMSSLVFPAFKDVISLGCAISLSGSYYREGTDVYRGYQLFVEWANSEYELRIDGRRYFFTLDCRDDGSKKGRDDEVGAQDIVEQLITEAKVDFILGPYSSGITEAVAEVVHDHQKIMVEGLGVSDSIFAREFNTTFLVSTKGSLYTRDIIMQLAALGAKTMVIAHEDKSFQRAVAYGAWKWANESGIDVLSVVEYARGILDVSGMIQDFQALNPDVFVAGTHYNEALLFGLTSSAFGFLPKAMVFTVGPSNPSFVSDLGSNAEYILGPTQWESSMSYEDKYMGTAAAYAARYVAKYGVQPSYQSAGGTAVCLALMVAIEEAQSTDMLSVLANLKTLNITSFYGPLGFNADNTGVKPMGGGQILDGKFSVVVPASAAVTSPVYPRPSGCSSGFVGNISSCLQCQAGTFANVGTNLCEKCSQGFYSTVGLAACLPCSAGTYSSSSGASTCNRCSVTTYQASINASECISCPANTHTNFLGAVSLEECECKSGFYNAFSEAGHECTACVSGAVCNGDRSQPIAAKGYWTDDGATFYYCGDDSAACPGGLAKQCGAGHSGFLCSSCIPGYARLGKHCVVCGAWAAPVSIVLAAIALGVLIWGMYYFAGRRNQAAVFKDVVRHQGETTNPGLGSSLGILVNYLQATAIVLNFKIPWSQWLLSWMQYFAVVNLDIDFLQLECAISNLSFVAKYTTKLLIPLFGVLGLAFLGIVKWIQWKTLSRKGRLNHNLPMSPADSSPTSSTLDRLPSQELGELTALSRDEAMKLDGESTRSTSPPASISKVERKYDADPKKRLADPVSTPGSPVSVGRSSSVGLLLPNRVHQIRDQDYSMPRIPRTNSDLSTRSRSNSIQQVIAKSRDIIFTHSAMEWRLAFNTFVTFVDIAFIYLVAQSFEYINCFIQPNKRWSLVSDPSIFCYESDWYSTLAVGIFGMLLYAGLVPALYFYACYKARTRLLHANFWALFSFLFFRFRKERYWWHLVIMVRKLLLAFFYVIFSQYASLQILGFFTITFGALILQSNHRPYSVDRLNMLESTSLAAHSIASLLIALLITNGFPPGHWEMFTEVGLFAVLTGPIVYFVIRLVLDWKKARRDSTMEQERGSESGSPLKPAGSNRVAPV